MKSSRFFFVVSVISSYFASALSGQIYASVKIITEVSGIDLRNDQPLKLNLTDAEKATVVLFLSSKCPCSISHLPTINLIARNYIDKGYKFIAFHSNVNEDVESSKAFFKAAKLEFPIIRDSKAEIADAFKAFKTPHVFVLNPKGEVVFQGGVDNSKVAEKASRFYLQEALEAIQDGKLPKEKEVRVLGCEIKRH